MLYNQDQYLINLGRKATTSALIGLLLAVILTFYFSLSKIITFFIIILFIYIFGTAFWGINKLKMWFNKYRYRLPSYIWYPAHLIIYLVGFLLGIIGYGFIEHFLLLLAMEQNKRGAGFIGSQIILLPYLGNLYAKKINY
ncbi:hypothetical protein [Halanaerobium salsuginis]|jgi:hypothetical protein|uniref:Uncharacterized protein n=1 Tax=Halanaerobium salsuginis TaxID=29563 RepID=A0A1I4IDV3_9FIRM|nr:hypothetical protein [Halanaerobium salsuginis]SFL52454.1 hypothetical protein SAMN02983006_01394 [Halanaerobium salsuginis]